MTAEIIAKHLRLHPEYITRLSIDLVNKHPEIKAVCDEVMPDHMSIRKQKAIEFISTQGSCNFHLGYCHFADDYDVALVAVKKDPSELQYVSERLKNNKSLVLEAVSRDGCSLQFASKELRNDIEVVTRAITSQIKSIIFAGTIPRNDKHIALLILKLNPIYISYMSDEILSEPDVYDSVLKLCDKLPKQICITDYDIALKFIRKNPIHYLNASLELRETKELLFEALKNWTFPLRGEHLFLYIPPNLLHDKEVAIEAMKRDGYRLSYFPHFNNDEDVVLAACTSHNNVLQFASKELVTNAQFLIKAIKINGTLISSKYLTNLSNDPVFIDELLTLYPQYIVYF